MTLIFRISIRRVYLGIKTCEVFLCFVAIVRVRVYYVDFFAFFVLRHWRVSQVFTPRMSAVVSNIRHLA